ANKLVGIYALSAVLGILDFDTGGVGWQFSRPNDGAYTSGLYTYNTAANAKQNLVISARHDTVFTSGGGMPDATEKMRILVNGNVGIGTASPTRRLHILGTNAIAGGLTFSSSAGTAVDRFAIYPTGNTSIAFQKL